MLRFLIAFLLFPSPLLAADDALDCDIKIEFNSETTGIDARAYSKIMDRVIATPAVTEKHVENVGATGERTLCLTIAEGRLDAVYEDLKAFVPAEAKSVWTRISTRDGREFKTRPPAKFARNPYLR